MRRRNGFIRVIEGLLYQAGASIAPILAGGPGVLSKYFPLFSPYRQSGLVQSGLPRRASANRLIKPTVGIQMAAFAPEADTHDHPHERLGRVANRPSQRRA
jgi:hypothetical protein